MLETAELNEADLAARVRQGQVLAGRAEAIENDRIKETRKRDWFCSAKSIDGRKPVSEIRSLRTSGASLTNDTFSA
ncbi:hypothetical protein [Paracoccus homiensis]|uniref:hypothetical protein n=1 Tax=Paracoccus homiensis TaxID=364199 RepID=UPI0015870D48|nr:hypothetical protein [Paracoccus homiensis]